MPYFDGIAGRVARAITPFVLSTARQKEHT